MACGDYTDLTEYLANGQIFDAVTCPFAQSMPAELFALLVFAPIGVGLYVASGSIAVPMVVAVVIGAAVIVQLPAIAANIAGIVIILGLTMLAMALVWLFNRRR